MHSIPINLIDLGRAIDLRSSQGQTLDFEEYLKSTTQNRDSKVYVMGWATSKNGSHMEAEVWVQIACGPTSSIPSTWEYQLKIHGTRAKSKWCCNFCHGAWNPSQEASQQLTIT